MNVADETSLWNAVRNSNYHAFEEVYYRYWKPMYAHAVRKIGDKDEAKDLVQDVFTDIWDRRNSLPEITSSFKHYLKKALVFKIATHFRKKGFRDQHIQDFEYFLSENNVSQETPADLGESEAQWAEMVALTDKTIREMPKKMRAVFLMSRSGYSVNEMAEKLHISPQTVRNQTSNALQRLRAAASKQAMEAGTLLLLCWLTIS